LKRRKEGEKKNVQEIDIKKKKGEVETEECSR